MTLVRTDPQLGGQANLFVRAGPVDHRPVDASHAREALFEYCLPADGLEQD
jgi:hypothetical protein